MASRVVSKDDHTPDGFRWLSLQKIYWEDPHGRARIWESAERTTRRGAVDGVAIVAKVLRRGQPPLVPVVRQYRPPIAGYCLELPAGLVDEGEEPGAAAVRELKEETGYSGRVVEVSPECQSDPGMSNANMHVVVLEVDGDAPENQDVQQQLEDGEFIQVELVPWAGLLQHLQEEMKRAGCEVDARLMSYALGIEHAKEIASLAVAAAAAEASAGGRAAAQQQLQQWHDSKSSGGAAAAGAPSSSGTSGPPLQQTRAPSAAAAGKAAASASSAEQLRGLLRSRSSWLLLAVGWTAGAAGCWLLTSRRAA